MHTRLLGIVTFHTKPPPIIEDPPVLEDPPNLEDPIGDDDVSDRLEDPVYYSVRFFFFFFFW